MKLIQKTSKNYLILSVILFVLGGIVLSIVLTTVMNKRLDEKLFYLKEVISKYYKYEYPLTIFESEELTEAENKLYPRDTIIYKDTLIFHAIDNIDGAEEFEKYRQLTAYETLQGERRKIITRDSLERNQVYVIIIILTTALVILSLLTGLWYLNTRMSQRIWNPFRKNLHALTEFSVQDQKPIELQESDIDEFKNLNESITSLTAKLSSDYNNLKEFTENASHEMQTPLAIMQSKVELLLQSENLTKQQSKELSSIYQAGKRLSKLNKTLLTLAKVENRQFSEIETINLTELIESKIEIYEDFIAQKNLSIKTELEPNTIIQANSTVIDMLIRNLLSNAIKHNINNGNIYCKLKPAYLFVSNSGNNPNVDPNTLFNRFKKESTSSDSSGLGLAIVKKICDINKWKIDYTYLEKQHQIMVRF